MYSQHSVDETCSLLVRKIMKTGYEVKPNARENKRKNAEEEQKSQAHKAKKQRSLSRCSEQSRSFLQVNLSPSWQPIKLRFAHLENHLKVTIGQMLLKVAPFNIRRKSIVCGIQ